MERKNTSVRKMALLALLAAVAYIMVALIRVPVVMFLSYEPKDVIITIGGFLFGPLAAFFISLVVSLVEMVTISGTGPIGALMNLISTCAFACTASLIYKKKHDLWGAVLGLLVGSVTMIGVMLLWNWLVTPVYLKYPREAVEAMLVPVFLPFNVLKAGLNSALTLLIYKPVSRGLRKARLLPPSGGGGKRSRIYIPLLALAVVITCIVVILSLQGII